MSCKAYNTDFLALYRKSSSTLVLDLDFSPCSSNYFTFLNIFFIYKIEPMIALIIIIHLKIYVKFFL